MRRKSKRTRGSEKAHPCSGMSQVNPNAETSFPTIPLFEELERQGFECLLISSRTLRRVAGRKSDVTDAQWIQTLPHDGLLVHAVRRPTGWRCGRWCGSGASWWSTARRTACPCRRRCCK